MALPCLGREDGDIIAAPSLPHRAGQRHHHPHRQQRNHQTCSDSLQCIMYFHNKQAHKAR